MTCAILAGNAYFFLGHRFGPISEDWPSTMKLDQKRRETQRRAYGNPDPGPTLAELWNTYSSTERLRRRHDATALARASSTDEKVNEIAASQFDSARPWLLRALENGQLDLPSSSAVEVRLGTGVHWPLFRQLVISLRRAIENDFANDRPDRGLELLTAVVRGAGTFRATDGLEEHHIRLTLLREACESIQAHIPHCPGASEQALLALLGALESIEHGDADLSRTFDDVVAQFSELMQSLPSLLASAGTLTQKTTVFLFPARAEQLRRIGINAHLRHREALTLKSFSSRSHAFQKLAKETEGGTFWTDPYIFRRDVRYRHLEIAAARILLLLEMHRLRHGVYPESLEQLGVHGSNVPEDPIAQGPFKYELAPEEKCFSLWSESLSHRAATRSTKLFIHDPNTHHKLPD